MKNEDNQVAIDPGYFTILMLQEALESKVLLTREYSNSSRVQAYLYECAMNIGGRRVAGENNGGTYGNRGRSTFSADNRIIFE